jgi:hypothetical protein
MSGLSARRSLHRRLPTQATAILTFLPCASAWHLSLVSQPGISAWLLASFLCSSCLAVCLPITLSRLQILIRQLEQTLLTYDQQWWV